MNKIKTTHDALQEAHEVLITNTMVQEDLIIADPSGMETLRITLCDAYQIDVNTAEECGGENGDTELIWGDDDDHGTPDDLARYVDGIMESARIW